MYDTKTKEEKMSINRERREKYEKEKAEKEAGITSEVSEEFHANVLSEEIELPKKSLKDKVLDKIADIPKEEDKSPRSRKRVDKTNDFIAQTLPLTLAGMIAMNSKELWAEEYKACAPTKEEVSAILLPLGAIISRHSSFSAKASQDAIDVIACVTALLTMSLRVGLTYKEIKQNERYSSSHRRTASENNTREGVPTVRSRHGMDSPEISYVHPSVNTVGNGIATDRPLEAEQVADLFSRDFAGRQAMGLAPRGIRESPRTDTD